jgi:hypothetical protein
VTQGIITASTSQPSHRGRRTLTPRWRTIALAVHVGLSVGWLGAAYTMVMLGAIAWWTADPQLRHDAYLLLHDTNLMVMTPCSLLGLSTGLVLALFSRWRLVHHYWILTKFILTLAAMLFAATYVSEQVTMAMTVTSHGAKADLGSLGWHIVLGSVGLVLVLATNTALAVVKPWGRTRWGRNSRSEAGN